MLPHKILIVEDDIALRALYEERFKVAGYHVFVAADGEEGVRLVLLEKPDVVLLDILLPKMGGLGVLRTLRSNPTVKDIPIAVMTAYDSDSYRLEAQPYADLFFLKTDYKPLQIVEEITELLDKSTKNTPKE